MQKTLVALAISVTITQGTPFGCSVPLPQPQEPQRDPAAEWVACVEEVHADPTGHPTLGDDAAYAECDTQYGIRTMPNGDLVEH